MNQKRVRSDTQAQVQALASQGLSDEAIAERLGLRRTTVKNYRTKTLIAVGSPISAREKQVSDFARQGLTNAVIGQQLGISRRTVEVHRQGALRKMGAGNAAHLANMHLDREKDALQALVAALEAKVTALETRVLKLEGKV